MTEENESVVYANRCKSRIIGCLMITDRDYTGTENIWKRMNLTGSCVADKERSPAIKNKKIYTGISLLVDAPVGTVAQLFKWSLQCTQSATRQAMQGNLEVPPLRSITLQK